MEENKQNVGAETAVSTSGQKQGEAKGKKGKKKLITGIIIGIVALISAFLLLIGIVIAVLVWPKKVNLNDYVVVEFTGYETVGYGTAYFDYQAFIEDYGNKIKYSRAMENSGYGDVYTLFGATPADAFYDCIDVTLSQTGNLSNGMEVSLVWNCNAQVMEEAFNYGIKYKDETYTVEGLEEVEMFDPFENVSVNLSGISGDGDAIIVWEDNSGVYEGLSLSYSQYSGLSNGDTITVTVKTWGDVIEYCTSNYGVCPSATEKEYTVSGLGEYVSSGEQITQDAFDSMIAQGMDTYSAFFAQTHDSQDTIDEISYQGYYLLTPKPGVENYDGFVYIVYKIRANWTVSSWGWDEKHLCPVEYYYVVQYDLPIIDGEGNCTVDVSQYNTNDNNTYYDMEFAPAGEPAEMFTVSNEGFKDLNQFFTECIQSRVDIYNYETNMTN